jgi:hypothetical protein
MKYTFASNLKGVIEAAVTSILYFWKCVPEVLAVLSRRGVEVKHLRGLSAL